MRYYVDGYKIKSRIFTEFAIESALCIPSANRTSVNGITPFLRAATL
jgi:hypothetical protein